MSRRNSSSLEKATLKTVWLTYLGPIGCLVTRRVSAWKKAYSLHSTGGPKADLRNAPICKDPSLAPAIEERLHSRAPLGTGVAVRPASTISVYPVTRRFRLSLNGARATPLSVIMAVINSAGV